MQKVTPSLWFNNQAKEAVEFYTSIFKNSKINDTLYYDEAGAKVAGMTPGDILTIEFQLDGQEFVALNGGPEFKFTEAISFIVNCESQSEVDEFWQKLTEGGEESVCGWLKDKFGVSWQVVPTVLNDLLKDPDPVKSTRVMKAMLEMKKIDINALKQAYEQS